MNKFTEEQKQLLLDIFHIYSPSRGEKKLIDFLTKFLTKNEIPFDIDEKGNIYSVRHKNKPLFSAHMDCVGDSECGWYVELIDIYPYKNDEIMKGVGNIGGDDKCGIFLILLMLLEKKEINFVFSIGEEIGNPDGIKTAVISMMNSNREVWESIPYCLVLDRKNPGDIICKENGYGSKEFDAMLEEIGGEFGYKSVRGGYSDTNTLKEYFNSANLSTGYHNPHTKNEFVSLNDLYNTYAYITKIYEELHTEERKQKKEEKTQPPAETAATAEFHTITEAEIDEKLKEIEDLQKSDPEKADTMLDQFLDGVYGV